MSAAADYTAGAEPALDVDLILGPPATLDGWRSAAPARWYIEGVLGPGICTAVSAAGGRKKSLLVETAYVQLAAGVALPWLGAFRTEGAPLRVLVLDGECGRSRLERRLRELVLGEHFTAEVADAALRNLDVRSIGAILQPGLALGAVEALLAVTRYDVLVLDPLRFFLPAGVESENDNLGMGAVIDRCGALAKRHELAALVVAHDSAAGKALRGASSQQNSFETLWQVEQPDETDRDYLVLANRKDRDPGTEYEVAVRTVRGEPVPEGRGRLYPVRFERTEVRTLTEKGGPRGADKATRWLAIVQAAEAHFDRTGTGLKPGELWKAAGVPESTFYRDLPRLTADGLLYQPEERGPIYPARARKGRR